MDDTRIDSRCIIIVLTIIIVLILIILGLIYFFQNISRIILKNIYKNYFFKLWPIVSKSPKLLNAAFPDFNVQYYVMSFPKNCTIEIIGIVPYNCNFFSIVMYDTNGNVFQSWNDSQFKDQTFDIEYITDCP